VTQQQIDAVRRNAKHSRKTRVNRVAQM
jgi:hypothetical protein